MRILWVEDHAQFVAMARPFLAGHEVAIAPTLGEARAMLRDSFDAILLDYDLPDGKGTELLRLNGLPPVIAASSHEDGNAALLAAGAVAACPKTAFSGIGAALDRLSR